MQQEKNRLTSYAMQAGLTLGIFWVFKYLFVIGAAEYPSLEFVNSFLSFFTPLLLLFYLVRYKHVLGTSKLKYWTGVKVGIMLFFFASIIESVIIIIHVMWIDTSYISFINEQTMELGQSLDFNESMMDELKSQSSYSPVIYVGRQLLSNVFIGFILSLMLTPLASRINIDIKNLKK